jgi:hypothetical protein
MSNYDDDDDDDDDLKNKLIATTMLKTKYNKKTHIFTNTEEEGKTHLLYSQTNKFVMI